MVAINRGEAKVRVRVRVRSVGTSFSIMPVVQQMPYGGYVDDWVRFRDDGRGEVALITTAYAITDTTTLAITTTALNFFTAATTTTTTTAAVVTSCITCCKVVRRR